MFRMINNEDNSVIEDKTISIVATNRPNVDDIIIYDYSYNHISEWANDRGNVWIPRFAYNKSDNTQIKYLKGISNIATDNTYINMDEWEIPLIFSENNIQYTGVWISESELENDLVAYSGQINNMEKLIQKIQYILKNKYIAGEQCIAGTSQHETEVFNVVGEEEFDGTNYDNSEICLFSEENIGKNFIISFNKIDISEDNTINGKELPTIIGAMDENSSTNLKNGKRLLSWI